MPMTRNKPRTYIAAELGAQPLADSTVVYEGACMGVHAATGRVRALVSGDLFAGFARQKVDSTTLVGGQAAATVPLAASGVVELAVSGATATSLGASVYATDDDTFSLTGGSVVGTVVRVPAAGVVECKFAALVPALTARQVGALAALTGDPKSVLDGATAGVSSAWFPYIPGMRLAWQLDSGTTSTTFSIDISADGVTSLGQAYTGVWASSTVAEISPPLYLTNPLARFIRFNVLTGGPLSVDRSV